MMPSIAPWTYMYMIKHVHVHVHVGNENAKYSHITHSNLCTMYTCIHIVFKPIRVVRLYWFEEVRCTLQIRAHVQCIYMEIVHDGYYSVPQMYSVHAHNHESASICTVYMYICIYTLYICTCIYTLYILTEKLHSAAGVMCASFLSTTLSSIHMATNTPRFARIVKDVLLCVNVCECVCTCVCVCNWKTIEYERRQEEVNPDQHLDH